MSRVLVIFVALAATAACRLDAPLATACRTDDDCVGESRCTASVCQAPASAASVDASGSGATRAPNETPGEDAQSGGPEAGADASPSGDGPIGGPDAPVRGGDAAGGAGGQDAGPLPDAAVVVPADAAAVVPADAAVVVPADAAVVVPADAAVVVPADASPVRQDTAVVAPDLAVPPDVGPDLGPDVGPDAPPPYTGDPCCVVAGLCEGATITPKNSGQVTIGPATDFVPLCGGWVLHGDRAANQVVVRNVFNNAVKTSYQLSTAPNRLLLDVARRLLIVSFGGATTALARVDLEMGKVTLMNLAAPVKDIALSGNGQVLALTGTDQYWARNLEVIDEHTGSGWKVTAKDVLGYGSLLAYRPAGGVLFMGVSGLSPSSLSRATLDWDARTITPLDSLTDNGSNCHEVVLSDDGAHLAVPCGAGNGQGYTIFDRSTDNLTTVMGEWMTGPYPVGAAFSRDGKYLAASDTQSIQVFSVSTHARLSTFPIPTCEYGSTGRVRVSLDSTHAFALTACGYMADSARLTWNRLP